MTRETAIGAHVRHACMNSPAVIAIDSTTVSCDEGSSVVVRFVPATPRNLVVRDIVTISLQKRVENQSERAAVIPIHPLIQSTLPDLRLQLAKFEIEENAANRIVIERQVDNTVRPR